MLIFKDDYIYLKDKCHTVFLLTLQESLYSARLDLFYIYWPCTSLLNIYKDKLQFKTKYTKSLLVKLLVVSSVPKSIAVEKAFCVLELSNINSFLACNIFEYDFIISCC